jgi:Methyltransferase domain
MTRGLVAKLTDLTRRAAREGLRRRGYDVVPRTFDSPLPDVTALPEDTWKPSELVGVDLRLPAAWALLEEELAPFIADFPADFEVRNGTYESVDAETLYALVRWSRPRLVIELGSGASTHLIQAAGPAEHRIFDPNPWAATKLGAVEGLTVTPLRAEDIPLTEFADLQAGDVLFVDTTHTVKTGGDVTRIMLEVLPRLASGVLVHVHDIFLPNDYPRPWVVDLRRAYAEQYLLHAFLLFNDAFEVLLPTHALAVADPERLGRAIPSFRPGDAPAAFWIRRR